MVGSLGYKLETFGYLDDLDGEIVIPLFFLQALQSLIDAGLVNGHLEGIFQVILDVLSLYRLLGYKNEGFNMGI